MRIHLMKVREIREPFPFCYHYDLQNSLLQKSIKQKGIIHPVWVVQKDRYYILDGHRRWYAARMGNISHIPVIIFPEKDLTKTFISALHVNVTTEKLTAIEQLKAVYLVQQFFDQKICEPITDILELSRVPDIVRISARVISLPLWLQKYFHQMDFSLRVIQRATQYALPPHLPWLKLAAIFKLNGLELIQLLENVQDIAKQNQIDVGEMWDFLRIDNFFQKNMTPQQKIQHLKAVIVEKRWPILHESNKNIKDVINAFPDFFKKVAQISWDKNFEQPGIMISMPVKNKKDLDRAINVLSKTEIRKKLIILLDQMKIPLKKAPPR